MFVSAGLKIDLSKTSLVPSENNAFVFYRMLVNE